MLYEIVANLINDCKVAKVANKEQELLAVLNHIQNKVDYICNIKDRHLQDYREVTTNDYNIIQNSNTAPTVNSKAITIEVGEGDYTFGYADFTNNFYDANGDLPDTVIIKTLPSSGILKYDGAVITADYEFNVFQSNKLVLVLDNNVTTNTSFTFQVSDNNVNKLYSNMATMNLTINDVANQPPSVVGTNEFSILYNGLYTFELDDFIGAANPGPGLMFVDPEGDALENIKITTLPTKGVLKLNNITVLANTLVSAAQISAGSFTYQASASETDSFTDPIGFSASDTGSHQFTAGGIMNAKASAYINLPPDSVGDGAIDVEEGAITVFTRAMFTTDTVPPYSDPENNAAHRLKLVTVPVTGSIKLDGVVQTAGDIVYFSDIDLGKLTYVQAANAGGTMPTFEFQIADEGSNIFVG